MCAKARRSANSEKGLSPCLVDGMTLRGKKSDARESYIEPVLPVGRRRQDILGAQRRAQARRRAFRDVQAASNFGDAQDRSVGRKESDDTDRASNAGQERFWFAHLPLVLQIL